MRLVDITSTRYAIARRYMIRLRRDDFEDPAELARLADDRQAAGGGVPPAVRVSGGSRSRRRSLIDQQGEKRQCSECEC